MENIKNKETIKKAVYASHKTPAFYAAKNSIETIERAYNLLDVDLKMSAFLGITAEEEAVTSIIRSIKRRGYDGVSNIKIGDHKMKAAFYPFCHSVFNAMQVIKPMNPMVSILLSEKTPRAILRLKIGEPPYEISQDPPLIFYTTNENGEIYDFEHELKDTPASDHNSLRKLTRKIHNLRNRLLFASTNGIAKIEKEDVKIFLEHREVRIYNLLVLFLCIDPYKEKQAFVQQALNLFLEITKKIKDHEDIQTNDDFSIPTIKINLNSGYLE